MAKSTKRRIFDEIQRQLKDDFKIELYDITKKNGYFIFDYGGDSVAWFKVKGLKPWRFGCWIRESEDKKYMLIEVFAQYERFIDKFKPSRSVLKTEFRLYKRKTKYYVSELDIDDLPFIIKFMKKHPVRAYQADIRYCDKIWEMDYTSSWFDMIKDIIEDEFSKFMKKYTYKKLHRWLRNWSRKGYIEAYYERDRLNEPPERVNDRYYIYTENIWADAQLSKYIKKIQKKWWIQGNFYLSSDPLNFYLDLTENYWEGDFPERDSKEYKEALVEVKDEFITSKRRQKEVERLV